MKGNTVTDWVDWSEIADRVTSGTRPQPLGPTEAHIVWQVEWHDGTRWAAREGMDKTQMQQEFAALVKEGREARLVQVILRSERILISETR